MDWISVFLESCIRTAVPLLIAGLGVVISSRAGIISIGTEGIMLIGALMGVVGSYISGSAFIGALVAMGSGLLVSLIFGFFTVDIHSDQTVVGTALNIFAIGFTVVINRVIFGTNSTVSNIETFNSIPIPGLSKIPIIGSALFNQPLLCYISFLTVIVAWFVMEHTSLGLKIRGVGDNPKACDTLGINVQRVRWSTIIYTGMLSGLAGAYMSMGQLSFFTEDMIAGRGYMVLAVVVFGNYTPVGVMLASLFFGGAGALQYIFTAANTGVPYQIWIMLPYIVTVLALCGIFHKTSNAAIYNGIPYKKE